MMVMTSVSERPVTEPAGTIGAAVCLASARRERGVGRAALRPGGAARAAARRGGAGGGGPVGGPGRGGGGVAPRGPPGAGGGPHGGAGAAARGPRSRDRHRDPPHGYPPLAR